MGEVGAVNKYVSIIIPVYNGSYSIADCIDSVCNQTYTNLEIIIIDDGSTDETKIICDELAQNDSRIKVYHIENCGVSYARNYGLGQATGDYIQFVDCDDKITKNATRIFVKQMEKSSVDQVICSYIKILPELWNPFNRLEKAGIYTNKEYLCCTLKDPGHHFYGVVWNKFYRRDLIEENKIRFIEGTSLGEDFVFNLEYLKHCCLVRIIRNRLYYYNCLVDNTLSRYEKNTEMCRKELLNRHLIFKAYKKTFMDLGLYEEYEKKVQQYWLIYLAMNLYYIKCLFRRWNQQQLKEWSEMLLGSEEIIKCRRTVSTFRLKLLVTYFGINQTLARLIKWILRTLRHNNENLMRKK